MWLNLFLGLQNKYPSSLLVLGTWPELSTGSMVECSVYSVVGQRAQATFKTNMKKSTINSQYLTKLLPSPSQTMCYALFFWGWWYCWEQQQQLQAQHLSHGHGPPVPLTPHPSGLQPPGIPPLGSSAGLLALSSALGGQSHLAIKDDKKHHDTEHHRGERHGRPD